MKYYSSIYLLFVFFFFYSFSSFSCEVELRELVKKTDVSEKFNDFKYLVKSGDKWFHLSQDDKCWIKIRHVKNSDIKKNFDLY